MEEQLKKCPCGETPTALNIEPQESTAGKRGYVSGNCCDEWLVEFRLGYNKPDSKEAKELAIKAWNSAPRKKNNMEWIPLGDKLPIRETECLCISMPREFYSVCVRKAGCFEDVWRGEILEDITHWMPLPKPPPEVKQ